MSELYELDKNEDIPHPEWVSWSNDRFECFTPTSETIGNIKEKSKQFMIDYKYILIAMLIVVLILFAWLYMYDKHK